jgi:hypothetical protein
MMKAASFSDYLVVLYHSRGRHIWQGCTLILLARSEFFTAVLLKRRAVFGVGCVVVGRVVVHVWNDGSAL